MEAESILYFHPAAEAMYKNDALKKHWWQKPALQARMLPQTDGGTPFLLTDCPVPSFYYRRQPWKPARLSELMENMLQETPGMTDAVLHPKIMTYVSEYRGRWEPRRETLELLMRSLLSSYAAGLFQEQGEAAVLLGSPRETAWQMEMTERLLAPYLKRINRLSFFYEEIEGVDIWEELAEYLDDYAYEYGLAPALLPYVGGKGGLRCGSKRYGGVILDYAQTARWLQLRPGERTVYADLCSDESKEAVYSRNGAQILYASPRKYLDTLVKSRYYVRGGNEQCADVR